MDGGPILALRGIGKRFGAVDALADVDLDVRRGETLAICGDNGAGKSTLIRIVAGALAPSAGRMRLRGEEVRFSSPADALGRGVATIYQDLALAPRMAVYQNVFMGAELERPTPIPGLAILDKPRMRAEARRYLERLRISIPDMDRPIDSLSGGQRQAVAIARALRWQAQIVIMDEPTAALGVVEARQVLDLILEIKAQGITVLLVSHNVHDVTEVADRAVIFRNGRTVRELALAGVRPEQLTLLITARG